MDCSLENTVAAMEANGLHVATCDFDGNDCISFEKGKLIAFNPKRLKTTSQRRTALLHECGHFKTGAFYLPYSPYQIKAQAEYKADKSAILTNITKEEIEQCVAAGITELWELAEHFNVTEDFMWKSYLFYKEVQPME